MSESMDTSTEQDQKAPHIFDIIVLEVEDVHTIVVTDHNNNCLKSFYTRNNKTCHSRLQLNYTPWCITQLGDNRVMSAVPNFHQILTVAVTPDLVYETHINTSKRYHSLVVMNPSRLAAGGDSYVDILNMQGEVMKSFTTFTYTNNKLFEFSDSMCVTNTGHILVSDFVKERVTCLTSEGQVVWIYCGRGKGQLQNPRGVTATDNGDILVADRSLKKVIQLRESGMYVRDVLTSHDGLTDPWSIYVDKHRTLYICDSGRLLKFECLRK